MIAWLILPLNSFLCALCCVSPVRADTTEDLLNIYGMTLGGPIADEVQAQIESIEDEIERANAMKRAVEEYNRSQRNLLQVGRDELDSLYKSAEEKINENIEVEEQIENGVLDMDIDSLIALDIQYKKNESTINEYLRAIDYHTIDYKQRNYDYDIAGLQSSLETQQVLYAEALDAYDLGDVENVQFPINVEKHVNSPYGTRIDPIEKNTMRFHAGTDYRCMTGTEVHALFNGVVSNCGWSDTIGYFVILQHGDNVKTLQCHLSEILVEKGQEVNQYDVIALSGGTGTRCTGPHLHLALYLNGTTYDVDQLWN